jgi:hypothetical protein
MPAQPTLVPPIAAPDGLTEIESGSVAAMTDSSSADRLKEINAKAKLTTWWPLALLAQAFWRSCGWQHLLH